MARGVAGIYLDAIRKHGASFDAIAFGIYDGAGYGANSNSRVFHQVFAEAAIGRAISGARGRNNRPHSA